jgi:hypothetical protein
LIGDGSTTTYTVTHSLGTDNVNISIFQASNLQVVFPTVGVTDPNNITVRFAVAPATNAYKVMVNV